jgi:hypothetical protein
MLIKINAAFSGPMKRDDDSRDIEKSSDLIGESLA